VENHSVWRKGKMRRLEGEGPMRIGSRETRRRSRFHHHWLVDEFLEGLRYAR